MMRWFATRCWYWGRAIWKSEVPPIYSCSSKGYFIETSAEVPPIASDYTGSRWLLDLLWPEGLELEEGEKGIVELHPLERMRVQSAERRMQNAERKTEDAG